MSPVRVSLAAAGVLAGLVLLAALPRPGHAQSCPAGRLLLLANGKIHTMDAKPTIVSKVRMANGRFVEVGICAAARSSRE